MIEIDPSEVTYPRDLTEFRARLFPKPEPAPARNWRNDLKDWAREQIEAEKRKAEHEAQEKRAEEDRRIEEMIAKYPDFADWRREDRGRITIAKIQAHVCKYFGYTRTELLSMRRAYRLARARHIAVYLAVAMTGQTLCEIGRRFDGRDHTTIINSIKRINSMLMAGDAKLEREIAELRDLIQPQHDIDDNQLILPFHEVA